MTSGVANVTAFNTTTASLTCGAASAGTAPYTYQWYRSTSAGFTPGGGNIVSGATSLTLNDTGLSAGTLYYYKCVATDNVAATATSNEVTVLTLSGAPVALDTFTDAATTALASHTGESGATWTVQTPWLSAAHDIKISNANRAMNLSADTFGSFYRASGSPASADYAVDAILHVVSLLGSGFVGVAGRINTASDEMYYAVYFPGSGEWSLVSRSGGFTTIGSNYSQALTVGRSYAVRLELNGTTISLKVDGVTRITGTDNAISATGKAGIMASGVASDSTGIHVDYFVASALAGGSTLTSGTPSVVTIGSTTATVTSTAASAGTAPYTYQWYRDTSAGFTPSGANDVVGATSLTLNDTGLSQGTTYYYKLITTDNASATVTSSEISLTAAVVGGQVLCVGDSITYGAHPDGQLTNTYPEDLAVCLGAEWAVTNLGVNGYDVSDITADAPSTVDPLYTATYANNVVAVLIGANDLYYGGALSWRTTYASLVGYCLARRAKGFKIVILTAVSRTDGDSSDELLFNNNRHPFNEEIRNTWRLFADALCDLAADARLGPDTASNNATYFSDLIHPTEVGAAIIAEHVATCVAQIDSPGGPGGVTPRTRPRRTR